MQLRQGARRLPLRTAIRNPNLNRKTMLFRLMARICPVVQFFQAFGRECWPQGSNTMEIKLSDVISTIRDELITIDIERRRRKVVAAFALTEIEIELQFTVEKTGARKGGFDLKVVSAGGEKQHKETEVQKIRIKLGPAGADSEPAPLGSRFSRKTRGRPVAPEEEVLPL